MKLVDKAINFVMRTCGVLAQEAGHHSEEKKITPGMPELIREVASEGAVMLENRILPLAEGTRVSVFGRVQIDYFCTGYGSGGDVNAPYKVNLLEGLRNCPDLVVNEALAKTYEDWVKANPVDHGAWGTWPRFYPEMPLSAEVAAKAAKESDVAVLVIGRASGEDREVELKPGSYYLTAEETKLLDAVTSAFENTILLFNIGGIMDFSFLEKYKEKLGAAIIVWQGGMEAGNGVADLLCGAVTPSGRLTDTIAWKYEDYPSAANFGGKEFNEYKEDIFVGYRYFETFRKDAVQYPFGFGRSYTEFSLEVAEITPFLNILVRVTNIGTEHAGRETLMLYIEKPQGKLVKPARELVCFAKTHELSPGEKEVRILNITKYHMASYDAEGVTGHKSCYVMEPGTYNFYLGGDVRSAKLIYSYEQEECEVVEQCSEWAAPAESFALLYGETSGKVPARERNIRQTILDNLPEAVELTGDKGYKLQDVKSGKITLDEFVAQLSLEELEAISRGAYQMNHPLGPKGNTGIFGGVTESLREKGVVPVVTTDGPSGIRLYESCSLLPMGTLLACTFNQRLMNRLFMGVAREMKERGTDVLLAPGMNIHRNPLCGRNFEYFSEDPFVSGKIAAAIVKGLQSVTGISACPKHFACNNQEYKRNRNDSRVSERALREIYLKGFEICVKEAKPINLMTSYNKINGVWGHYHYELVQGILRGEWKYEGNVMTDWWMRSSKSPEFPEMKDNAYRVRSGVDVLMPGGKLITFFSHKPDGTLLATYGKPDGITLGELQRTAKNVLRCVMELKL